VSGSRIEKVVVEVELLYVEPIDAFRYFPAVIGIGILTIQTKAGLVLIHWVLIFYASGGGAWQTGE